MAQNLAADNAELVAALNRDSIRLSTKSGKEIRVLRSADWKAIARDFAAHTGEAVKVG